MCSKVSVTLNISCYKEDLGSSDIIIQRVDSNSSSYHLKELLSDTREMMVINYLLVNINNNDILFGFSL